MSRIVKNDRIVINGAKNSIKCTGPNSIGEHVSALNDDQGMKINYYEIIEHAKEQANEIIEKAREKANIIEIDAQRAAVKTMETAKEEGRANGYSEGYDNGYAQGLKEGNDLGRAQYEDAINEVQELKKKYQEDYDNLYKISERYMLELAIELHEKSLAMPWVVMTGCILS